MRQAAETETTTEHGNINPVNHPVTPKIMTPIGAKSLKITDTTLRDAHQSQLATRMRTEDMLPIAEAIDRIGYFSVEMWGGATFDSSLRFLNENPWDRIRLLKKKMPKTPFQMLLRGQNLVGYRHYADDVVERFVKHAADLGIDIFRIFDALNDFRNIRKAMDVAKKCGKIVEGAISYTVSPVHNIDLYVKQAKELENMGSDIICIKDMAGLLIPSVTRDLVAAIKATVKLPVHLHTHATTGLVGMNIQCAVEGGVDIIDTAISPLAMGTSQYATECLVAALKGTPHDTGLSLHALHEIADYFKEVKKKYSEFESDFRSVDVKILESQIPGGMISNMENQLREQNALDKMDEVLREIPRVRKDLGYPPLVTPTSQIVGSQATLNVLTGERYKIITKETRDCLLGKYGKLPGTIDAALLARVSENQQLVECRPADLLPPEWEQVGKECGATISADEDRLTYAMFPKVALKYFEYRNKSAESATNPAPELPQPAPTAPTPLAQAKTNNTATPAPAPITAGPAMYNVRVNGKAYAVEILVGAVTGGNPGATAVSAATVAVPSAAPTHKHAVTSPLPGTVLSVKCKVGDAVKIGDTLLLLESMKMETEIKSHNDGIVQTVLVFEGANVQSGEPLIYLS